MKTWCGPLALLLSASFHALAAEPEAPAPPVTPPPATEPATPPAAPTPPAPAPTTQPATPEAPAAPAAKRVEVDKSVQLLRAYEGDKLVWEIHVSTGRWDGATVNGDFKAQEKERLHRSKKYHNAPMPYCVHVTGNVFIHGFTSVPKYPASHGCVRMPMTGENLAKKFWEWCDIGTPISIVGHWDK